MHVVANFIFKGNTSIKDNSQRNIPILQETNEDKPIKKDLPVLQDAKKEISRQEKFKELINRADNSSGLEEQFKRALYKRRNDKVKDQTDRRECSG